MFEVILKRFENPDEVREFPLAKFELVKIGGLTVGKATYEPGWRWSEHMGATGSQCCPVEHVGVVISGRAVAATNDGTIFQLGEGDLFHIPPGYDSWVIGDEPYVSLHMLGAEDYAQQKLTDPEGSKII